jgi:hypothetical protein
MRPISAAVVLLAVETGAAVVSHADLAREMS